MAHLLLMYQYLRAKREVNELTAKSFKFSSKKNRIKDNIEKTQKYYTDAKARIASQAKMMTSAASVFFQNNFGLGAGMVSNFVNPYSMGSANSGFVLGCLGNQDFVSNVLGNIGYSGSLDSLDVQDLYQRQMQGALVKDKDGNYPDGITEEDVKAFGALMSAAQQYQYQMQTQCNNANAMYQQNVSIWEQAMNAQLEAEQDAALEPLNYEETMMELEETSTKTKLEEKKQELDNIKQELSQRVKEDAVSFGLS